jgi:hypothetical protein
VEPRKPFLLRIDPAVFSALRRWADDELRSLNGQIEFILRRSLQDAGRLGKQRGGGRAEDQHGVGDSPSDTEKGG